ncbi:hypothetical protein ACSQ67_009194 [Phaseolus vulgaris]
MEINAAEAATNRSYEDFEPYCKWLTQEGQVILEINLKDGFPTREGFDAAPWCSSFMLLCFGLFFAAPTGYIAVLYAINGEDYAVN